MAQLHQIIGAILRDIAQARVTSDVYSREVSRYYEQDSLLRTFPVPRSEIREVDIDLRFAISEVAVDPGRVEDREARIARILERYSERITEDVFDNLRGSGNIREIKEWQDLVKQLAASALPLELKNQILNFFETKSDVLIKVTKENDTVHVSLDKRQSSSGILDIIDTRIYTRPDVVEISNKYRRNRLLERVKKSVAPGFQDQLEAMNRELEFIGASEEFKVEVDVTTDKLQEIPEEAISSIKISTVIRNYTWSQVEQKDAKVIRRLVPE